MLYQILSLIVVLIHFAFIGFVVLGAWLALRWHWLIWAHIPSVVWGVLVEAFNWTCPLTPLENALHRMAGEAGYAGDFVQHYLMPVLYFGLTSRGLQIAGCVFVFVLNAVAYGILMMRRKRARNAAPCAEAAEAGLP